MAFTLLGSAKNGTALTTATTGTAAFSPATSANSVLVCLVFTDHSTTSPRIVPTSVTDTLGNTWTYVTDGGLAVTQFLSVAIYYVAKNRASGANTVTVNLNGTPVGWAIYVAEYSTTNGNGATANGAYGASNTTNNATSLNVAGTATVGDLVCVAAGLHNTTTVTLSTSTTGYNTRQTSTSTNQNSAFFDRLSAASTSESVTVSFASHRYEGGAGATFTENPPPTIVSGVVAAQTEAAPGGVGVTSAVGTKPDVATAAPQGVGQTTVVGPLVHGGPYAPLVLAERGLQNYYRLNEASFNATADSADLKSGNTANYSGAGVTLNQTGALGGDTDKATLFPQSAGNDQWYALNQTPNDFSWAFWFKSTGGLGTGTWDQGAGLCSMRPSGGGRMAGCSLLANGKIAFGDYDLTTLQSYTTPNAYNDGAWHLVVFTRVRATGALVLYVDGQQVASGLGAQTNLPLDATYIVLARNDANGGFGQQLVATFDEVSFYNIALDPAVVAELYRTGLSAPTASLTTSAPAGSYSIFSAAQGVTAALNTTAPTPSASVVATGQAPNQASSAPAGSAPVVAQGTTASLNLAAPSGAPQTQAQGTASAQATQAPVGVAQSVAQGTTASLTFAAPSSGITTLIAAQGQAAGETLTAPAGKTESAVPGTTSAIATAAPVGATNAAQVVTGAVVNLLFAAPMGAVGEAIQAPAPVDLSTQAPLGTPTTQVVGTTPNLTTLAPAGIAGVDRVYGQAPGLALTAPPAAIDVSILGPTSALVEAAQAGTTQIAVTGTTPDQALASQPAGYDLAVSAPTAQLALSAPAGVSTVAAGGQTAQVALGAATGAFSLVVTAPTAALTFTAPLGQTIGGGISVTVEPAEVHYWPDQGILFGQTAELALFAPQGEPTTTLTVPTAGTDVEAPAGSWFTTVLGQTPNIGFTAPQGQALQSWVEGQPAALDTQAPQGSLATSLSAPTAQSLFAAPAGGTNVSVRMFPVYEEGQTFALHLRLEQSPPPVQWQPRLLPSSWSATLKQPSWRAELRKE